MAESRYYAVSSGNGNDGVSHLFPDYIVKTDRPYALALLAAVTNFKRGEGYAWAQENVEIDGEADYTIYATFFESPEFQEERAEMEKRLASLDPETEQDEIEELESELEDFQPDCAWLCFEVFPWDASEDQQARHPLPIYESIEECFGEDCALAKDEAN